MRYRPEQPLPDEQQKAYKRAKVIERVTVAYFLSLIFILYLTLGQSQAMKAAWIEDILALFPPIAFLVASRFRDREPNRRFPFGYHRSITVAYVVSAVALFGLGLFIAIDSVHKLIAGDHPPIGTVEILDGQIWLGWLMIAALLYGLFPSLVLGRMKLPLADTLHDKVLHADAKMNQADWLTAGAAIAGIVGIGFGLWWADAVAALVISVDILADGVKFLRESVSDLMDEAPQTADEKQPHEVIGKVKREVSGASWVREGTVGLREHGHRITGEVRVVPHSDQRLRERLEELTERIHALDWRLSGVIVGAVGSIEDAPSGVSLDDAPEPER